MKRDKSYFSARPDSHLPLSPKSLCRPLSSKQMRPKSTYSNKLPTLNSVTDFNSSFASSTKPSSIKYHIENEKLYEQTVQLKIILKNLKREFLEIKKGNYSKDYQITLKDKKINDLIEVGPEDETTRDKTTLLKNIKKQTKTIQAEIEELKLENAALQKNSKLTKMNELTIEKHVIEEQISLINSLYNNSLSLNDVNQNKYKEFDNLNDSISKQTVILNSLHDELLKLEENEQYMQSQINSINSKIYKSEENFRKNEDDIAKLKKQNENLLNDSVVNAKYSNGYVNQETLLGEISKVRKEINFFKKKNKENQEHIAELKKKNAVLMEKAKEKGILYEEKESNVVKIRVPKKPNKEETDQRLKKLKETLEKSKTIEAQLDKQRKIYQEKLKELNAASQEQIEFGIDSSNPFYTENDANDPIVSSKFTSSQFNQFTYILFKNFEAKKITLDYAKEKIIDEIVNDIGMNESSISSDEQFENLVEKLSLKIVDVLNCNNDYNLKLLQIFIGCLLINSEGNVTKLIEYFVVLFSYTKVYSKEEEENMKNKLKTKYREKLLKVILCLRNESSEKKYISLLEMKNIIDNNEIVLKDKYIEFIFYLMKNFDDSQSKWDDLLISKLTELFDTKEDSLNVTEITKEDFKKNISQAFDLINKGMSNKKETLRNLFRDFIERKMIKRKEKSSSEGDVVSVENFHEELRKIGVLLTDLQLSCLCTKYCINNELEYVDISLLDSDLKDSSSSSVKEVRSDTNEDISEHELGGITNYSS